MDGFHTPQRFRVLALVAACSCIAAHARAESFTTNIIDGVTTNVAGAFTLGDTGPFNFLLLTNGGALTNTTGTVGNSNTAFGNLAIIAGPGSVWANAPSLTIGVRGASNQVSVLDGARLVSSVVIGIGSYDTSIGNRLLVSGANSFLGADRLFLGTYGSDNEFIVEQGARVGLSFLTVNSESSPVGRNHIVIRNPGTLVTISNGPLSVSRSPDNLVSITDGATLAVQSLDLGSLPAGNANILSVSGQNSSMVVSNGLSLGWIASDNMALIGDSAELRVQRIDVGFASSGNQFRVSGGGRVVTTVVPNANASLAVGSTANGAANLVWLQDSGTIWSNSGYVSIGTAGSQNTLVISNGAAMIDTIGSIGGIKVGESAGSVGNRIEVAGPGSTLSTKFSLTVGGSGSQNSLLLSGGGRLNSSSATIGQSLDARENRVRVTGAGTVWSNTSSLVLGRDGPANVMTLADGAALDAGWVAVGTNSAGNELLISDGSRGMAYMLTLGGAYGADDNRMVIRGPGTTWTNLGSVWVGDGGSGNTLIVTNGARLQLSQAGALSGITVGRGKGERNMLSVSGPGTLVRVPGDLSVGSVGSSNVMVLSEGANVSSGTGLIGVNASATHNHAIVTDPGTLWTMNRLSVGVVGRSNQLTIANGATVRAQTLDTGGQNGQTNRVVVSGTNSLLFVTNQLDIRDAFIGGELLVLDGASVYGSSSTVGFAGPGQSAAVAGPGSSWSNNVFTLGQNSSSNRLLLAAGGRMDSAVAVLGYLSSSSFNTASVTGTGTRWNASELTVGHAGAGNQLLVSEGARLTTSNTWLGFNGVLTTTLGNCNYLQGDNRVLVTGPGSFWESRGDLRLGYQSIGNSIVVGNGATLLASSITIGEFRGGIPPTNCPLYNQANVLLVDGGCVIVTNSTASATVESKNGPLRILSGQLEADRLHSGGGGLTRFEFFGGVAKVKNFSAYTGAQIIVGDGLHNATLELNNGFYDITGDLYLFPHASIRGRGGIYGFRTNNGTLGNLIGQPSMLEARVNDRLGPQATLDFVIAGTNPGVTYGTINLSWSAVLKGRLRVALRNSFVPTPANSFRIISFASATNFFINATNGSRLKTVDGLGSFLVGYSPTSITLSDYQSTDLDNDGLEDAWAINHFGHSPLTLSEQLADSDDDGASNADEFRAGTDPTNAGSVFKAIISVSGDTALVEFDCVDGKSYRVWFSNDLQSWQEVREPTFAYPQPGRCQWNDDGKDTGGKRSVPRFYRVSVE